jgi:ketosteroid isomerase-like protein
MTNSDRTPTPAGVVERYYAIVADLESSTQDLASVVNPEIRIVEHPNAISPRGGVRGYDQVLAAHAAGKRLLSEQGFELHEVLACGDRVAVRATWHGRLARAHGALPEGAVLRAHVASLLTVGEDGRIAEHETFDCYEPLPLGG